MDELEELGLDGLIFNVFIPKPVTHRISWPKFHGESFLQGLVHPDAQTVLQRICFQVVQDKAALEDTKEWVKSVKSTEGWTKKR